MMTYEACAIAREMIKQKRAAADYAKEIGDAGVYNSLSREVAALQRLVDHADGKDGSKPAVNSQEAMLKPLTLEQAAEAGSLWIEYRYIDRIQPAIAVCDPSSNLLGIINITYTSAPNNCCLKAFDLHRCGIEWRPWAHRPTDKERNAASWEAMQNGETDPV